MKKFINISKRILSENDQIVQIGAANGQYVDPVYPLLKERKDLRLLAVEPVPYLFNQLKQTYSHNPNVTCVQCAICTELKPVEMCYMFAQEHCPDWVLGLGTQLPIRNCLSKFPEHIQKIKAEGITLEELCKRQGIKRIDALVIDVEGYEWNILQQLPINSYYPKIISYENVCIPEKEKKSIKKFADDADYNTNVIGNDTLLVKNTI